MKKQKVKLIWIPLLIVFFTFTFFSNCFSSEKEIISPFAGSWYPANKEFLQLQIEQYLRKVEPQHLDHIIALILPHAGYMYSGQTSCYGIKEILGKKYSRVIIIGPSHYLPMYNKFSVPDVESYITPFGKVNVDTPFVEKLQKFPEFTEQDYSFHYNEHSAQIELPLLQYALSNFKVVVITLGVLDLETTYKIAEELKPLIDKNTLVVVSSDFTHYGINYGYLPFPFDENTPLNLTCLDMKAVSCILKLDYKALSDFIAETKDTICGVCGIEILLQLLPEKTKAHVLDYETSGQLTHNFENSVSYVAIAFTGKWGDHENITKKGSLSKCSEETLSSKDKNALLNLAKKSIEFYAENGRVPTPEELGIKITQPMKEKRGVFVTLKEADQLRGCVGIIIPLYPLYEGVIQEAINAAFMDTRFYPVQKSEMPMLSVEISVLTVPQKINNWEEIRLGRDGIILKKDGLSAVFLPQVAIEQNWNIEQTLSHLAMKANLPSDAWKSSELMVFQTEIFSLISDIPWRKKH